MNVSRSAANIGLTAVSIIAERVQRVANLAGRRRQREEHEVAGGRRLARGQRVMLARAREGGELVRAAACRRRCIDPGAEGVRPWRAPGAWPAGSSLMP